MDAQSKVSVLISSKPIVGMKAIWLSIWYTLPTPYRPTKTAQKFGYSAPRRLTMKRCMSMKFTAAPKPTTRNRRRLRQNSTRYGAIFGRNAASNSAYAAGWHFIKIVTC
jgi:hypothetical protein